MRFALFVGLLAGLQSVDAAEVRLRASAVCASTVVRLSDVAEIDAEDPALAAALAEIPLCPAPAAGGERSLSQHDVRQLLALSGVEPALVRITGSERVAILGENVASSLQPRHPLPSGIRQAAFQSPAKKPPAAIRPALPEKAPEPAKLVERGASVNVFARAADVRVATSGKALEAGAAGETILVELEGGREKVHALIVAAQTVEVLAPARR